MSTPVPERTATSGSVATGAARGDAAPVTEPTNPTKAPFKAARFMAMSDAVTASISSRTPGARLAPLHRLAEGRMRLIARGLFVVGLALFIVALLAASGTAAWLEAGGAIALLLVSYALRSRFRHDVIYRPLHERRDRTGDNQNARTRHDR